MKWITSLCFLAFVYSLTLSADARDKAPSLMLSAQDTQHILHDTFVVSRTVADIPESVKQEFAQQQRGQPFYMAEPGKPFQASDVITNPGLPWVRLAFVAINEHYCILHYEGGGYASQTLVALFQRTGVTAMLVYTGQGRTVYRDMTELRQAIQENRLFQTKQFIL